MNCKDNSQCGRSHEMILGLMAISQKEMAKAPENLRGYANALLDHMTKDNEFVSPFIPHVNILCKNNAIWLGFEKNGCWHMAIISQRRYGSELEIQVEAHVKSLDPQKKTSSENMMERIAESLNQQIRAFALAQSRSGGNSYVN